MEFRLGSCTALNGNWTLWEYSRRNPDLILEGRASALN